MPHKWSTPFFRQLAERVAALGGAYNAHLHLDRFATLEDRYLADAGRGVVETSHASLHAKHALIGAIHRSAAYTEPDLRSRVNAALDIMVDCGTTRADTMVDVTADNVGLSALETIRRIKAERAADINLAIAAYSPFGFRDDEPERWEVFRAGVELSDFIGCLPEADDTDEYPDHIGFDAHCERMLRLGIETGKSIHVHTDQRNEPTENGTERLIEAVRRVGAPAGADGAPGVWAVHMISPSTYDDARFDRLVAGLLDTGIGLICCPSAALGMRQLRPLHTPTYNCIPRVLELLAAGVPVRLASDNIADICSPSTTPDLADEVFILSAAIRFYDIRVLARLAAGQPLSKDELTRVRQHLEDNRAQIEQTLASLRLF